MQFAWNASRLRKYSQQQTWAWSFGAWFEDIKHDQMIKVSPGAITATDEAMQLNQTWEGVGDMSPQSKKIKKISLKLRSSSLLPIQTAQV